MHNQKPALAANSDNKKEDRNKKIIMASMQNFQKGDFDAMLKDAAGDFTDYGDGTTPPVHGVDSLKGFIKMIENSIPDYKGEDLKYYADGDYVFVHGNWTGTFKNDLMGIKATGKPVRFKDVDIFKLNDEGKVVEHSSVQNFGAVLMTSGKMQ